jgi:hypothetical protein
MKLQQVFIEEGKLSSALSIVASTGSGDSYEQEDFGHSSSLPNYFSTFR